MRITTTNIFTHRNKALCLSMMSWEFGILSLFLPYCDQLEVVEETAVPGKKNTA